MLNLLRLRAATPEVVVGDIESNKANILTCMAQASADCCDLLVLPELCLTAYTCSDLFLQPLFIRHALKAAGEIIAATTGTVVVFGLPFAKGGKLFNCAAVALGGKLLGLVPKRNIPNYNEFYELRHFTPGSTDAPEYLDTPYGVVPFGSQLFDFGDGFVLGCEICEDLWVAHTPSDDLCARGATVIANLSASDEIIGKADYRRSIVSAKSGSAACAYVYSDAGEGESTTDLVFSGHKMICENGRILQENEPFDGKDITADVDVEFLLHERQRMNTFTSLPAGDFLRAYPFTVQHKPDVLRTFDPYPFVPADPTRRHQRCGEIFAIQSAGLQKRLRHIGTPKAILGISGGLDSTLALLVTCRAFDNLGRSRKDIICATMPCFGTTKRTRSNAEALCEAMGTTLRTIDITVAVRQHFHDIGHDEANRNVAYENTQARERTQILMDLANDLGGIVVGTGDLSEMALGWATYNGDHMSMYAVNASIPKTLVRYLVGWYADETGGATGDILRDILDTPVSPELLPPTDGEISQKTEELVGPYDLHDFFLYGFLRLGYSPSKLFDAACLAFEGKFSRRVILQWLQGFCKRFFSQQYKRSCMPDGPKVGSVALSPRGDLRMPSDASAAVWLAEVSTIKLL